MRCAIASKRIKAFNKDPAWVRDTIESQSHLNCALAAVRRYAVVHEARQGAVESLLELVSPYTDLSFDEKGLN
jgi:hypothetical protein